MTWLPELTDEIARQDKKYGPFTGKEPGRMRLAVACLEDEVREARDAWREEREIAGWPHLREELFQAAALAIRAVRSIDDQAV